ncbi:hypothetical protein PsorP6_011418 [Peronosclerospora sorghi]|uniref:Uncharacterized protein n=1 Tax=Peronosclerospora sorghi TaxID=230839 RepID=A0ACC0WKG1_9STRA|nr:hypothetical protein PsorP6_011418 [Peronosclerospora sorghi]
MPFYLCGHDDVEEMSESLRQDASANICQSQGVARIPFQMNLMELEEKKRRLLEDVLRLEAQAQDVDRKWDALSRRILTLPMVFSIRIVRSSNHFVKADIKEWMEILSS